MEPHISLLALVKLFLRLSRVERTATVVESLKRFPLVLNTSYEILFSVFYFYPSVYILLFSSFCCYLLHRTPGVLQATGER